MVPMKYRSILTNKFVMASIVVGVAILAVARFQLAYPTQWDEVKLGMSRAEVYELVGNPSQSMGDIKGDFWWVDNFTQQHELHAFFENEKVISMHILRRIGTTHHFRQMVARSESIDTVSYCQLRENWQFYNGKTVRLETDLYWSIHGFYFADKACSISDSQHPSLPHDGLTAFTFEESQADALSRRFDKFPLNALSPVARIVVIGKLSRRIPGPILSDMIADETSFNFEIDSMEKAVQSE